MKGTNLEGEIICFEFGSCLGEDSKMQSNCSPKLTVGAKMKTEQGVKKMRGS